MEHGFSFTQLSCRAFSNFNGNADCNWSGVCGVEREVNCPYNSVEWTALAVLVAQHIRCLSKLRKDGALDGLEVDRRIHVHNLTAMAEVVVQRRCAAAEL